MLRGHSILVPVVVIGLVLAIAAEPQASDAARSRPNEFTSHLNPALPILGAQVQISPSWSDADRFHPAVAYNSQHHEYLVIWHDNFSSARGISMQRMSSTGQLVGSSSQLLGSNDRAQPAVAYNRTNDEYHVVYMRDVSGNGSKYEIWGCRVAWDLSSMDSEFLIFTWANRSFWTPKVAWNSYRNEYLVVATAFDTTTGKANDVAGRRVMADGTTPYPGDSISSQSQTLQPHQADVTYNLAADEYLVVWRRWYSGNDWDIWGARVRGDNGTVIVAEFAINNAGADQQFPAVTTNTQDRYFVVWQYQYSPGPWNIVGQELDVSGNNLGGSITPFPSGHSQWYPDVAAKPGVTRDYFVVWQMTTFAGEEIWAARCTFEASPYTCSEYQVGYGTSWNYASPAVAVGIPGHLIAYEGVPTGGYRHIYGRMWLPEALFLPLTLR